MILQSQKSKVGNGFSREKVKVKQGHTLPYSSANLFLRLFWLLEATCIPCLLALIQESHLCDICFCPHVFSDSDLLPPSLR